MVSKAFDFLLVVVASGLVSLLLSIVGYVVLAVLFAFALVPVFVLFGNNIVMEISNFFNPDYCIRVIYAIIFFSVMAYYLKIPNAKTIFKKWRDGRKAILKG